MTISIDWATKIILVNKVDMVLIQTVPSVIYQLDLDVFRLILKDIEDSSDGMAFERTHKHSESVTVGGAVLARVIQFVNGYTVEFEDDGTAAGQYRVQTVGANSNIGSVIQVNQVSVSTSNSAGLQDLNSLQAASFNGEVTVDNTSIYTGSTFPVGTRQFPVNNMVDAHAIAEGRGIRVFRFAKAMTLTALDFSDGYTFKGDSATNVVVTINSDANVSKCTFENLTIQGTLDNGNILMSCAILDISDVNGFIFQCALMGVVTLGGTAQSTIMNSYSGIAGGDNAPTIDMGGSGCALALRDYSGGIKIRNRTGTDGISIDMQSGTVTIESTVTAGEITVRGGGSLVDNSTGTAVIVDETVPTLASKALSRNQFIALTNGGVSD